MGHTFDPKTLMAMARIGAEHYVEWIRSHFPDLIPGAKRSYKERRKKGAIQPVALAPKKKETKKRGWTEAQKRAKAEWFKTPAGQRQLKRMQAGRRAQLKKGA